MDILKELLNEKFEIPKPAIKVTAGKGRLYLYNLPLCRKKFFNSFSWLEKEREVEFTNGKKETRKYVSILFSEKEKGMDAGGTYSVSIRNANDSTFDVILGINCLKEDQKIESFLFSGDYIRLIAELVTVKASAEPSAEPSAETSAETTA